MINTAKQQDAVVCLCVWGRFTDVVEHGIDSDFFSGPYKKAFDECQKQYSETGSVDVDVVAFATEIPKERWQKPVSYNVQRFCDELKRANYRLAMHGIAVKVAELAENDEVENDDLRAIAADAFLKIGENKNNTKAINRSETIRQIIDNVGKKEAFTQTNLRGLDKMLGGGMVAGRLYYVGARPGMGKTVFAQHVCTQAAKQGKHAAFFSCEMTGEQVLKRELVEATGVNDSKWETRDGVTRLIDKAQHVIDKTIHVFESPGIRIAEIANTCKKLKLQGKLDLVCVDYLQLVRGSGDYKGNRVQEVGEVSRELKFLSTSLKVPVIALSQLSRAVEQRENKRPMLSDLRETGDIEQDGDVIMMLYRESYYSKEKEDCGIEILVEKNRHGETGVAKAVFVGELFRFGNLDHDYAS